MKLKIAIPVSVFLLVLSFGGFAQATKQPPVASVLDVNGTVFVTRDGKAATLGLFDNLFVGDMIRIAKGAKLVFSHSATKAEYRSNTSAEFEIINDGIKIKSGEAPLSKRLTELAIAAMVPSANGGRTTVGAVRMRSLTPPQTDPANRETILTLNPEFFWPPFSPDLTYVFTLKQSGNVIIQTRTKESSARLLSTQHLEWGKEYDWTLSIAEDPDKPAVVRSFKTILKSALDEIMAMTPAESAEFSDWVVYAKTLEKAGAFAGARDVWRRLAKARPGIQELETLAK
ncbi:MAG: hypothetical protein WCL29_01700 [Pseudomonadota bacterium]